VSLASLTNISANAIVIVYKGEQNKENKIVQKYQTV
jgi:hypothetical protein